MSNFHHDYLNLLGPSSLLLLASCNPMHLLFCTDVQVNYSNSQDLYLLAHNILQFTGLSFYSEDHKLLLLLWGSQVLTSTQITSFSYHTAPKLAIVNFINSYSWHLDTRKFLSIPSSSKGSWGSQAFISILRYKRSYFLFSSTSSSWFNVDLQALALIQLLLHCLEDNSSVLLPAPEP